MDSRFFLFFVLATLFLVSVQGQHSDPQPVGGNHTHPGWDTGVPGDVEQRPPPSDEQQACIARVQECFDEAALCCGCEDDPVQCHFRECPDCRYDEKFCFREVMSDPVCASMATRDLPTF
mmetsp:Transcript_780/g.1168  ORF Transcript_780/g.1168 Transcript_780/m.1168 type:complete len:120 (-) Transcript_780:6-365(-)